MNSQQSGFSNRFVVQFKPGASGGIVLRQVAANSSGITGLGATEIPVAGKSKTLLEYAKHEQELFNAEVLRVSGTTESLTPYNAPSGETPVVVNKAVPLFS